MRPLIICKSARHIARAGKALILFTGSRGTPLLRFISTLFILLGLAVQPAHAVELSSDSNPATAGYFHLSWSGESRQHSYELQESADAAFAHYRTLYRGADLGSLISGKPDGHYYYRVVSAGQASNTVMVEVRHHPLSRAITFFILGALVFLATLMVIIRGSRNS